MLHIVQLQVLEDQSLVRARTKGLAKGKQDHGQGIDVKVGEKKEHDERKDIGHKGHHHRPAAPEPVGIHPGRDFQ